jgi:hypothetical protein
MSESEDSEGVDDGPTQTTEPKGPGEPIEVPIPTREDVERDLRKLIAPEQPPAPRGPKR